ncbi:EVE domain-containing protein [Alicyclobacillus curvatus]|nr:EVE domain-containing protein [Alicyclobacillus curvatus]
MDNLDCFIFVANDVPKSETVTVSAETIATELLQRELWAFTEQAPLKKKLKVGDHVLIYLAGKNRRHFVASVVIQSELTRFDKDTSEARLMAELGISFMRSGIHLKDVTWFPQPVQIQPLLSDLAFVKDKKNYGLHLRLPIVRVPKGDFGTILQETLKPIPGRH